jgi:hypothetical protein
MVTAYARLGRMPSVKAKLHGTPAATAKAFLKTGDDDDDVHDDTDPWMLSYMIGIWVFNEEDGTMHIDLVMQ